MCTLPDPLYEVNNTGVKIPCDVEHYLKGGKRGNIDLCIGNVRHHHSANGNSSIRGVSLH